jgi:calcineurin-like phosphoesterase family protein
MKIILAKNQRLFFTSDTHYNHTNICRGISNWDGRRGTRDFNSLDEMNASIIDGINSTVGEDDVLVHLGDWSFGGFDYSFPRKPRSSYPTKQRGDPKNIR